MAEKKEPAVKYTSQPGIAKYPHLNEPDTFEGQKPKFKTGFELEPEAAKLIFASIDAHMPAAKALAAKYVKDTHEAAKKKGLKAKEVEEQKVAEMWKERKMAISFSTSALTHSGRKMA